jgi:hypothetical protein
VVSDSSTRLATPQVRAALAGFAARTPRVRGGDGDRGFEGDN